MYEVLSRPQDSSHSRSDISRVKCISRRCHFWPKALGDQWWKDVAVKNIKTSFTQQIQSRNISDFRVLYRCAKPPSRIDKKHHMKQNLQRFLREERAQYDVSHVEHDNARFGLLIVLLKYENSICRRLWLQPLDAFIFYTASMCCIGGFYGQQTGFGY